MTKRKSPAAESVVIDPTQAALNLKQLAAYLGLPSLWQARTLVWEGRIPALKVGRNLIVRRADADLYLSSAVPVPVADREWLTRRKAAQ